MIAKYTVLSASHCLLKYVENCTGTQFPPHSLRYEHVISIVLLILTLVGVAALLLTQDSMLLRR